MMKYLLFFFYFFVVSAQGQGFRDRVLPQKWILNSTRLDTATVLHFTEFNKEKVGINTMVWHFLPTGKIEYDYQTDPNIEACLGVDFLDMDIDASYWRWNTNTLTLTLQVKGGFAGIDDFLLRNEYKVHFNFIENQLQGFDLVLAKPLVFKILNQEYVKP